MRTTRSGSLPPLLIYRSPEFWAVRGEFFFFNILMGFVPLVAIVVGCALSGSAALAKIFDRDDDLYRTSRAVSPAERRRNVVRIGGRLVGTGAQRGLCLVTEEEHGKNGWYERGRDTVGDDVKLMTAGGETIDVDWRVADWAPDPPLEVVTPERHAFWNEHLRAVYGGRRREACLRDAPIFVTGCREPKTGKVRNCHSERLVLTPGDGTAQPRIDVRAAKLAGKGSLVGIALGLVVFYIYWSLVRGRPLVRALLANLPARKIPKAIFFLIPAPVVAWGVARLLALLPFDPGGISADRDGYALATVALTLAALAAILVRRQRRAVLEASAPVIDTPTMPIAKARGGLVELAVRVADDAPLVTGPLTNSAHAFAALNLKVVERSGKNHAVVSDTDRHLQPLVPVYDTSGQGELDLSKGAADLRAVRVVVRRGSFSTRAYDALLGDRPSIPAATVIEERFVDRGESLYVLGYVEHVEPAPGDAYREMRGVPRIAPLLVYAGSERSLLQRLAIERAYLLVAEIVSWSIFSLIVAFSLYLMML